MMRPKSPLAVEAEKLCKKFPDTPTRTLARRLATKYKTTVEAARDSVRYFRGTKEHSLKKYATAKREPQPAGWVPEEPPKSLAKPWTRVVLGNDISVAIMSDQHIPYQCDGALNAAIDWCVKRNPDIVLLNGDFGDFYGQSRFEKDPSKRKPLRDLKYVKKWMAWYRYKFPNARIVYKMGNHDERWDKWLWNFAPEISDHPRMRLSNWLGLKNLGIELVKDQRPIMAGKLPIFHGHELGRSLFSPVNPARGAFLRTHHTVLVGHSHQTSGHADTNIWHDETFCFSTGCLCDMSPEYARVNHWNHGFAYVEVDKTGEFDVENLRISKDWKVRKS